MDRLSIVIEAQKADYAEAVERLHARAFGPGRFARTAYRVREQAGAQSGLAFTAWVGSLLVGAVQLTPIHIHEVRAFMLGPLTVDPAFEGRGIGRTLLKRCEEEAKHQKAAFILLVGDEAYYQRAGYQRVPLGKIVLPGPVNPMRVLVLPLQEGGITQVAGEVHGG